uniref:NADH dehydrogenase subunit 4L n=1 Tax=Phoneutria boliviensis TaxID=2598454 RepID=UPI001D0F960C|nr:NADH dehydrogenase subunit 4L [Phoneutria boliviensis]UBY46228.1 NADH dehydrogenase subunit 4L [Phoneutria boliviensis]
MKMMMITMSILSMCWWRKNIIPMLLSMELMLISLYFFLTSSNSLISMSSLLIMLTLMASGSSMGLSLLVSLSRSHNSSSSTPINMLTFAKINYSNLYPNMILK